jgi:hypothetical protein
VPLGSIGCVALVLFLSSCSAVPLVQREQPVEAQALAPRYSVVFVIHGDGNYRFHDSAGNAYKADEEALDGALSVAVNNPDAEVFVFHQKRRRHTLLFFPRRDGSFHYYRHGQLVAKESYWRDQGESRFDPEVALYNRFRASERSRPMQLFLYFGHEIPEFDGLGYDASYSQRAFTVSDLADGLQQFTRDATKFDLVVLSTCFNGTPHTVSALAPYTRSIVASPGNLHLSYFDLKPLERLDLGLQKGEMTLFATNFAQHSFDKLSEDLQTPVTVVAYDVDRVEGYLRAVEGEYARALDSLKEQSPGFFDHYDCAEDAAYALPTMSEGVNVFYRPARFGHLAHKENHSGWECWKLPTYSLTKQ